MYYGQISYVQIANSPKHRVVDAKTGKIEYATFSLYDAPVTNPRWCKHMDLKFSKNTVKEIIEQNKFSLLLSVYSFIFHSVLEIALNERGVALCKIYSQTRLTKLVYMDFANELGDHYEVKSYRNWIEIRKKP